MTQTFDPAIKFVLVPPADPELRPRLELEPRLAVLLAEREGESFGWADLLDLCETRHVLEPELVTSGGQQ